MFDPIFTLLSLQFIYCVCVCVYIYIHYVALSNLDFLTRFIFNRRWMNVGSAKCICVYVCVPHCILGIHAVQYSAVCSSILKLFAAI